MISLSHLCGYNRHLAPLVYHPCQVLWDNGTKSCFAPGFRDLVPFLGSICCNPFPVGHGFEWYRNISKWFKCINMYRNVSKCISLPTLPHILLAQWLKSLRSSMAQFRRHSSNQAPEKLKPYRHSTLQLKWRNIQSIPNDYKALQTRKSYEICSTTFLTSYPTFVWRSFKEFSSFNEFPTSLLRISDGRGCPKDWRVCDKSKLAQCLGACRWCLPPRA